MSNRDPQQGDRAPAPGRSRKGLRRSFEDFRTRFARRRSRGEMTSAERELYRADRPPDVTSARAKSSRHGKSTADKWNQ